MTNLFADMPKLTKGDLEEINFILKIGKSRRGDTVTRYDPGRTWTEIALLDKETLHAAFVHYYARHYSFYESSTRETYRKLFGARPNVKEDKERDRKNALYSTTPFTKRG